MGSLRSTVRPASVDLLAAVGLTIAVNAVVFVPVLQATALRVPLGFAFVCLVPGYVVVAALFPERYRADGADDEDSRVSPLRGTARSTGVTGAERVLLSVVLSLVVVPVIAYTWNFTAEGIRLAPVLLSVSGFTIAVAVFATLRRSRLPDDVTARPGVSDSPEEVGVAANGGGSPRLVNAVLVLALVFFAATAGFAVLELSPDEQYSEFYLLSADGETFAGAGEPPVVTPGDQQTVDVVVENHEGQPTEYTVVVVGQTLAGSGNDSAVRSQTELDRFTVAADQNETVVRDYTFTAPPGGDQSRVVWLLYPGETPETVSTASAANHVYLWVASNASEPTRASPRLAVSGPAGPARRSA